MDRVDGRGELAHPTLYVRVVPGGRPLRGWGSVSRAVACGDAEGNRSINNQIIKIKRRDLYMNIGFIIGIPRFLPATKY